MIWYLHLSSGFEIVRYLPDIKSASRLEYYDFCRIGIKITRIVLQVNMHRLRESDFW